jgi:hypothetical protein
MSSIRFVVVVVILAVLVAMLFAALTTPPRCQSVDAEKISSEKVEALRAEGWFPDPTDGHERLYSPGCTSPGSGVMGV